VYECRETPKLAITRQTVSELKYQLIYNSKSIEQIAKELHFPDTSYM
jgi:AraC-like DNA-binding protein